KRFESLEGDAIGALEAGLAERPGRAFRSGAEGELAADWRQVGKRREVILRLGALGDRERVLVDGRRGIERDEPKRRQAAVELRGGRGRVASGFAGPLVVELEVGRGVSGIEVDLS